MPPRPTVTVLGAGALGAAMAARLGETGYRCPTVEPHPRRAHAAAAQSSGVTAVDSLGEAVAGAPTVITVLRDGDAVAQVMEEAINDVGRDTVWVQASTIGPEHARSLADLAAEHDVAFLDAPVSGSTAPARQGKLVWLVAGDERPSPWRVRCSTRSAPRCSTSAPASRAARSSWWSMPG